MPEYEYICKDCGKKFSKGLTVDEHDHKRVACPKCGSKKVQQEYSTFFAVTTHKS